MPAWSSTPPPTDAALPYRVIRTPANGRLSGVITCTDPVGTNTHFVRSRTIPCEGRDKCELCADGHGWRWHCYVSLLIRETLEHVILELTAAASDPLRNYLKMHHNLRHCGITAHRPSGRHNGRIVVTCKPADPSRWHLPEPPNIAKILCHLWGVQYTETPLQAMSRQLAQSVAVKSSQDDGRYTAEQLAGKVHREPEVTHPCRPSSKPTTLPASSPDSATPDVTTPKRPNANASAAALHTAKGTTRPFPPLPTGT